MKADVKNKAGAGSPNFPLHAEWERVEHLACFVMDRRRGREYRAENVERLQALQDLVVFTRDNRHNTHWANLPLEGISDMAWDILSCVLAPDCLPRVAGLYEQIQGGNRAYPSAALLQELLSIGAEESDFLIRELEESGFLFQRELIRRDEYHSLAPLYPAPGVVSRLRGGREEHHVPGAYVVRQRPLWDDLVLPGQRKRMLREFINRVQYRDVVVNEWGGLDTGGPLALFSGPSGTGKTFAASVMANEMGWPLYRVDLGRLVSKYIGETEKNLNRLFEAAHGKGIMLQFDEADSLFGKRGDVRDARDRYANMEVSHLLARIENHRGPCILTTNLRDHLDGAFIRRFQMVIVFQRPDADDRFLLWRKLLPPHAPLGGDLDLRAVAEAVNLTGGNIRNAALHAAYMAASRGKEIGVPEIALSVWRELNKDGRKRTPSDMGFLKEHIKKEDR